MPAEQEDFDVDAFIGQSTTDASFSTETLKVPEGTFVAQIDDKMTGRVITTKDGEKRKIVTLQWNILDDSARAALDGRDPKAYQDVWLDLDDMGGLDASKGKNVDLGILREATGQQNMSGWNIGALRGQIAMIKVVHEKNPETGRTYVRVRKVAARPQ